MPVKSIKSSHYIDYDKLRDAVRKEKEARAVYLQAISNDTGIHSSQLTRFLNTESETIGIDLTVSMIKWLGRKVEDFTVARRPVKAHVDSPEQRQLRMARTFLDRSGLEAREGETAIDTMMRLLAEARSQGVFDEKVASGV